MIEHNEVYDCSTGIHLKSNDSGVAFDEDGNNIVRYNLIHDVDGDAIHLGQNPFGSGEPTKIHQNLIYDCGTGVAFQELGIAGRFNTHVKVVNNTIVDCDRAFDMLYPTAAAAGRLFHNNIVSGCTLPIRSFGTPTEQQDQTKNDFEHNVYFDYPGYLCDLDQEGGGRAQLTITDWKASPYSQDNTAPAAITTDPQFVNAGARDYRLQGGSPALTQGRVTQSIGGVDGATIPAGCYITGTETIGPEP